MISNALGVVGSELHALSVELWCLFEMTRSTVSVQDGQLFKGPALYGLLP